MVPLRNVLAAACVAAVLAGCGSSKKSYFETEGLRAPEGSCSIKPSRIGLAEKIRNIDEGNGCEVRNAWNIQSVGSVSFSQPATVNCGMAEPSARLARGHGTARGAACLWRKRRERRRCSVLCLPPAKQPARRQDERAWLRQRHRHCRLHARERPQGDGAWWAGGAGERSSGFLRAVHDEACGEFHTVLGPNADANHRDHIHLDLQNRKSGKSYCR